MANFLLARGLLVNSIVKKVAITSAGQTQFSCTYALFIVIFKPMAVIKSGQNWHNASLTEKKNIV